MNQIEFTQSRATTATLVKSCDYDDYTMLDGDAWAEKQKQWHGLWSNPALGNWPYVVYANGCTGDRYIIKEYSEHTVKTWIYTEHTGDKDRKPSDPMLAINQYTNHLDQLKAYWSDKV